MASSFAASRLKRDRSLSPNVALNFRDLTMDRYNKHMEGMFLGGYEVTILQFFIKSNHRVNLSHFPVH